MDLFSDEDIEEGVQPISHADYERLIKYLEEKNPPAILPIQIAYYAGLRIGEVCGLTWQDINLDEQFLTIKRSIRYDGVKHKNIIGPTNENVNIKCDTFLTFFQLIFRISSSNSSPAE